MSSPRLAVTTSVVHDVIALPVTRHCVVAYRRKVPARCPRRRIVAALWEETALSLSVHSSSSNPYLGHGPTRRTSHPSWRTNVGIYVRMQGPTMRAAQLLTFPGAPTPHTSLASGRHVRESASATPRARRARGAGRRAICARSVERGEEREPPMSRRDGRRKTGADARRIWRIVALGVCLEIRHVSGRRADRHRHLRRGVWCPCGSERVGVDGGERGAFR